MFTKKEYTDAVISLNDFQITINSFKDFVNGLNLPFTTNYQVIIDKLKINLFDDLLKVDTGLKYEYDNLLKTDEAKKKKVSDKINLDGHEVTIQISKYLQDLNNFTQRFNNSFWNEQKLNLENVFKRFDGNLDNYLKQYVIDFTGYEKEVKLINDYASMLNKLVQFADDNEQERRNLVDLATLFVNTLNVETDWLGITKVNVSETKLYNYLIQVKDREDDSE